MPTRGEKITNEWIPAGVYPERSVRAGMVIITAVRFVRPKKSQIEAENTGLSLKYVGYMKIGKIR